MATATYVPVEQYLHSSYEPDAEYVDGEIQERAAGEFDHGAWQVAITEFFLLRRQEWKQRVITELRVRVSRTRFRVPDVTVVERVGPFEEVEQIVRTPPLAVFEILSPDDTIARLMVKLEDYAKMGIANIFVVDPKGGKYRYVRGSLELLERGVSEMSGGRVVDFGEVERLFG